ncbi:hypothetical protein [Spirillospora sp. NPDC047279]|uniref:sugar phosphate isomerase/epimerase family protein n=1 Tax=Spirillospora sp. NPDC047279 TaxID=3155478 RepID=UPI0033E033F6
MSQTLSVFQSLWAMEGLPWRGPAPWTLDERVARIAQAGFAGAAVDLGAAEAPAASEIAPLLRTFGLRAQVFAFVNADRPLSAALDYAAEIEAELLVVCGQVFPSDVGEAVTLVRSWMKESEAAGLPFQLETHRYTLTNDLGFTCRLLDALPELELAVDLSHYVCGNEIPDGPDVRADALIGQVIERGASFQGRIATRGQIQVSPHFPRHRAVVQRFQDWWERGLRSWRARAGAGADLTYCCELGTVPYAITGPDGTELSDRWAEALWLKRQAEDLFATTLSTATSTATATATASEGT